MKYRNKKRMKAEDDVLKWIRVVCSDVFQIPWVKTYTVIMLLFHTASLLTQTVYLIKNFELDYLLEHTPAFATTFYGVVVYSGFILKGSRPTRYLRDLQFWTADAATSKTEQKIKTESFWLTVFAAVNNSGTVLVGIMIATSNKIPADITGENSYFSLVCTTFLTLLISSFSVHACQVIYFTQHFKFQMYMLQDHVEALMEVDGLPRCINAVRQDHDYQKEIQERLKFCMERYCYLLEEFSALVSEIGIFILLFVVGGLVQGIGVIVFFVNSWDCLARLTKFIVPFQFLIGIGVMAIAGQKAEDAVEQVTQQFLGISWYLMDRSNRRNFLTFIPCITKPFSIKFMDRVGLNYKTGLAIVRGMYTFGSILVQCRTRGA